MKRRRWKRKKKQIQTGHCFEQSASKSQEPNILRLPISVDTACHNERIQNMIYKQ